jgi:hypothetical protein
MKSKNMEIDVAGICSIVHDCTGCAGESKRCCSSYEVTITTKELQNIDGCIPLAARFCPNLKLHHGYENVFEEISSDLFCIDTNEDGVCAFGYFKDTRILCSLHSAADKFGISFKNAKPRSCLLWPLAIFEGTANILSIQDDAFEFTCNTRSGKDTFSLCPSIARNIEWAFGAAFRNRVQDAVNKRLPWTNIPLGGLSGH